MWAARPDDKSGGPKSPVGCKCNPESPKSFWMNTCVLHEKFCWRLTLFRIWKLFDNSLFSDFYKLFYLAIWIIWHFRYYLVILFINFDVIAVRFSIKYIKIDSLNYTKHTYCSHCYRTINTKTILSKPTLFRS